MPDAQILNTKTLQGTTKTVFVIADGESVDINPANGEFQVWSRTPTALNFANEQSVILIISPVNDYMIMWTTIGVVWINGFAPSLANDRYTYIELCKAGLIIYGSEKIRK